jgi:hypothetical protein
MTHPAYLREKARQLRTAKQLTIDELADRLALSRSTIYYWVRDLPIPGSNPRGEWPAGAQALGCRAMRTKYRRLREEAYAEGRAMFEDLMHEPTFRDFLCLYMAEGSKRSRNVVALCNSDVEIVKLANRWICRFASNPVTYSIQYHADQDLQELVEFWGAELGIDPESIGLQRKSNSNGLRGRTWRSKYGVLTVRSADTYFRARLQAWIDCLRETWS